MFDPESVEHLISLAGTAADQVRSAMAQAPRLEYSVATASTLTIDCNDPGSELTPLLPGLTATTLDDDVTWHLAGVRRRATGRTRLTFEDRVVTQLRRTSHHMSVPAGSTTLDELFTRLAAFAGVDCSLEPVRRTVPAAVTIDGNGWRGVTGLADDHGLWRYSTGTRLVVGSLDWILTTAPADTLDEDSDQLDRVAFTIDVGRDVDVAAADTNTWAPAIGSVTELTGLGAASGRWSVTSYASTLGDDTGRATWTRPAQDQPWH